VERSARRSRPSVDRSPFSFLDDVRLWHATKDHGKDWTAISAKAFDGLRSEDRLARRWRGAAFGTFVRREFGREAADARVTDGPDEATDVPSRGRGRSEPKVLRVGLGRRHRQLPVSFFVLSPRWYFATAGGAGALIADAFRGVGGGDEAPGTDDGSPPAVERTRLRVHARGLPR
jgi:hypothetical protein